MSRKKKLLEKLNMKTYWRQTSFDLCPSVRVTVNSMHYHYFQRGK